jgi:Anticodon binding domain
MISDEIEQMMLRTGYFGKDEGVPEAARRWIDAFVQAYGKELRTTEEALPVIAALRAESVLVPALDLERLRSRQALFYLDAVGQYVDDQSELRDLPLSHDLLVIAGEFGLAPDDALWAVRTALTGKASGPPLELLFPLLGHDRILMRIGAISSHLLHGRGLEPIKFGPRGEPFTPISGSSEAGRTGEAGN